MQRGEAEHIYGNVVRTVPFLSMLLNAEMGPHGPTLRILILISASQQF